MMKVLVVGSGGREHALVWKLKSSPHVSEIFCAPGNGGIAADATCVPITSDKIVELARFAGDLSIDLTVVGPELPLSLGISDVFHRSGLRVFGPSGDAAQIECSKVFAKQFMQRHNIPTAPFRICNSFDEARRCIKSKEFGYPLVLKADGLAAGKGVIIAGNEEEALQAAQSLMVDKRFGPAGEQIVIEQFLEGREVSFMVICDGERFLPLLPSRDYKRAFDNDEGPNTGGMGAFSSPADLNKKMHIRILIDIVGPVVEAMIEEGRWYRGLLYCGLILTTDGPVVLEFNCRFGDPETQVVLPLIENDLFEILCAAADGEMQRVSPLIPVGSGLTVVIAAEGYPGSYQTGMRIDGLTEASEVEGVTVFHAGTELKDGEIVTAGGRVLNVTAVAPHLPQAIFHAYQAVEMIKFEGARYRKDVAHQVARV